MTFGQYYRLFTESSYKNLFDVDEKQVWKNEVWEMVQNTYRPLGGIQGSGFESVDDMVMNIPMWKIFIKNGKMRAAVLYKDKNGRKLVAVATDNSKEGKNALLDILKIEFTRAYGEISGPLLKFVKRNLPEVLDLYAFTFDQAQVIAHKNGHTITPVEDSEYEYIRVIKNEPHRKIMLGTMGKKII